MDMRNSQATMEKYRRSPQWEEYKSGEQHVDLSADVLTTGYWPMAAQGAQCPIPPELLPATDAFKGYVSSRLCYSGLYLYIFICGCLSLFFQGARDRSNLKCVHFFSVLCLHRYYMKAHTGRKLTWQMNMGTVDMKVQRRERENVCVCVV